MFISFQNFGIYRPRSDSIYMKVYESVKIEIFENRVENINLIKASYATVTNFIPYTSHFVLQTKFGKEVK